MLFTTKSAIDSTISHSDPGSLTVLFKYQIARADNPRFKGSLTYSNTKVVNSLYSFLEMRGTTEAQ